MITGPPQLYDRDALFDLIDGLYPRIIGLIDRDPDSPTFGSCDREYWMYRLHDFDSGVLQQAGLTLAALSLLVESMEVAPRRHLDRRHVPFWRSLALAVNQRTVHLLQRGGGMLDEYYPGERSFPGTVFAAYATLKSALLLGQDEVVRSPGLAATARELTGRRATPASNQDVAAAAFLALYAQTTGFRKEEVAATVAALLGGARQDGLFLEYGGLDLGYGSVTLNYLACLVADGSYDAARPLRGLAGVLGSFITPAGRLGGEFASRSTTYVLPYGFLVAAAADAGLAGRFTSLDLRTAFAKLDDRYLMHYCAPSLALAAWRLSDHGVPPQAPAPSRGTWHHELFSEGKLFVASRGRSAIFVGLNKGCTFQVEDNGNTVVDCGYRASRNGKVYATCVMDDEASARVTVSDEAIEFQVRARFLRYRVLVPSSKSTIVLRLLKVLGPLLNVVFKNVLIKKPQVLENVTLQRRLWLNLVAGEVLVEDAIEGLDQVAELHVSPASSFRLVPSARFHQEGEERAFLTFRASETPWRRVYKLTGVRAAP